LWWSDVVSKAMLRGPVTSPPFSDKEGKQKDKIPETNISPENRLWKRRFQLETIIFRGYIC